MYNQIDNIYQNLISEINGIFVTSHNCSELIWAINDIENVDIRDRFHAIVNACATGKVYDLNFRKYV